MKAVGKLRCYKRQIFLLILIVLNFNLLIGQINTIFSFDTSAFKVSEYINGKGDTIPSISYPEIGQYSAHDEILLPVKQVRYLVPKNATNFELSVISDCNNIIELQTSIKISENKKDTFCEIPVTIAKSDSERAIISGIGYLGGQYKIVTIKILPCIITTVKNQLSVTGNLKLNLNWTELDLPDNLVLTNNQKNRNDAIDRLVYLIDNIEDFAKYYPEERSVERTVDREGTNEYAIVTPRRFMEYFRPLEAIWANKGYTTCIYALEDVIDPTAQGDIFTNNNDEASRLRQFIRTQYEVNELQYILLAGKYPEMPIRYVGKAYDTYLDDPADIYFSDLNTNWVYRNFAVTPKDNLLDRFPEVFVGRLPISTTQDIENYIEKMYIYEYQYDKSELSYLNNGIYTLENDEVMSKFNETSIKSFYNIFNENNLLDLSAVNHGDITGKSIVQAINSYPAVIHNFIGHGNPGGIALRDTIIGKDKMSYGLTALDDEESNFIKELSNGIDNLVNYKYPGWSYSMSCLLMPFDEYPNYEVKRNFGESYTIGGRYGGVIFMGNCREISADPQIMSNFFKVLTEVYKKADSCMRGVISSEIHALHKASVEYELIEDFYTQNIYGDPLTILWAGEPQRPKYNISTNNDGTKFSLHSNIHRYNIGYNNLDILGYSCTEEYDSTVTDHCIPINTIMTIYGKNLVSEILPVYLQNFTFNSGTQNTILVKDLYCRSDLDPSFPNGSITFNPNAEVTINALRKVDLDYGTIFKSGCDVKIFAKEEVFLGHLNVPNGASLYVEAPKIIWPKDHVTFAPAAEVTLIENGRQVYPEINKLKSKTSSIDVKPMVVSGRTWWYDAEIVSQCSQEIGLRITSPIEIDGKTWYIVEQVKTATQKYNEDWNVLDTPKILCYIRQEGSKVYTRLFSTYVIERQPLWQQYVGPCNYLAWGWSKLNLNPWSDVAILEYELYGEDGTEFNYTSDGDFENKKYAKLKFIGSQEIINSDQTYNRFEVSLIDEPYPNLSPGIAEHFYSIPEIGYILPSSSSKINSELFFAPLGTVLYATIPYQSNPKLRYVTDENNRIIYEGIGGLKLWELEQDGVNDAKIDIPTVKDLWYTVNGKLIDKPSSPGIYIHREDHKVSKVVMR